MATGLEFEVKRPLPPTEFSRRGFLQDGWQRLRVWFQQNGVA